MTYLGLRPGEKLYEEKLMAEEGLKKTRNELIHGQIKEQGYPRNSIFFDQNKRQSIKKRYGLEGKISIFYMPTWRGTANGIDDVDQVSEVQLQKWKPGQLYCRLRS